MKKLFTLSMILAGSIVTFAQDGSEDVETLMEKSDLATNKKGEVVTPQSEDFSIGFDAIPMLEAVGDIVKFNSGGATAIDSVTTWKVSQTLTGKYFVDPQTAYRARLRFNNSGSTVVSFDSPNPDTTKKTQTQKTKNSDMILALGLEKRRGYGRLQGFYGAEVQIGYGRASNIKTKYVEAYEANDAPRNTLVRAGGTFTLGVRGFVGVEYFIARKISLGAEYGLGLGYSITGKGKTITEQTDGDGNAEEVTSQGTSGERGWTTGTDINQGSFFINFFF